MTLDEVILKLVKEREIADQAEFRVLLKRARHEITQPTLSRHLRKLGIQKVAGRYQRVESLAREIPAFELEQVPPNLLVIRTRPGYAQPLAVRLDHRKVEGMAGTLAGDDAVFIAVAASASLESVAAAVERLLMGAAAG